VNAVAAPADRLDDAVAAALADPGLEERVAREPGYAADLVAGAAALAADAFTGGDRARLDEAHRTLYLLYAQDAWSPVGAPRQNQHDPTMAAVLRALERGFEAALARHALPEAPPEEPEAFCAWLTDLALERELAPPTGMGELLREATTLGQMREIVAQRSLFFLKEPDPWAMVIPSLRGEAKAGLLDLLMDEYGWGRYEHMHSTVYEVLMRRLGLDTGFDAYLDRTAPEFLAVLNYQAMLARHRRLCRRMYGYIYLVEADSPRSMANYLAAYRRLGIEDEDVLRFYDLHVTADEGHQEVALREVILPVVREEPEAREEIARGVLEGVHLHHGFSAHLAAAFRAGRSSLRPPGGPT